MARQPSDESTSVGRKCLRAKVLLPEPLGPIRTTSDRFGIEICINKSFPDDHTRRQGSGILHGIVPALFDQPRWCGMSVNEKLRRIMTARTAGRQAINPFS